MILILLGEMMIDLYTWPTPNGHKVHIMLEEIEVTYNVIPININKGDQFAPDFLKISPNNKMPAMVDRNGPNGLEYSLFESGAILIYLAEKTGLFLPKDQIKRFDVIQWLMFQMGGLGPMFGQAHHFIHYAPEEIDYAIDRYVNEAGRLYRVLDDQLSKYEFLAGNEYTIADIACFPWALNPGRKCQKPSDFKHVARWLQTIEKRPAVERGMKVLANERRDMSKGLDDETRRNLFGSAQYKKY